MRDNGVFAHDVHVSDDELRRLAAAGAWVAHCPSSNAFLGSGTFPLRRHAEQGVRFALETTGSADVLQTAVYSTAPGGVTGIIGAPPFGTEVSLDINQLLTMGRHVVGVVEGESIPGVFIPRLIELWRQGRFPVDRLMSMYDLDDIDRAAHDAEEGRVIKAVVRT